MTRLIGVILISTLLLAGSCVAASQRGLLWRVVQTCIANSKLTGAAFPCLKVELGGGPQTGFAVLRSPLDSIHIIVTPTIRTIGIEAERLRGTSAPEYFADAWASRHFVTDALGHPLPRRDLALAVNSRPGRSQDQLHIHVDCLRPSVRDVLDHQGAALYVRKWRRLVTLPQAPPYWALALQSDELRGVNVFDLVAHGLKIAADDMDETTIVVAGTDAVYGKKGFVVLARQILPNGHDLAHGEALLDHDCRTYR